MGRLAGFSLVVALIGGLAVLVSLTKAHAQSAADSMHPTWEDQDIYS